MKFAEEHRARWATVGGVCGLLGVAAYFVAVSVPLSGMAWHLNSFSIGLLLIVAVMGLYRVLTVDRATISAQIGLVFCLIGGVLLTLMLVLQHTTHAYWAASEKSSGAAEEVRRGLTFIHLGIDVAWDLFIATGLILLSLNMIRHPRFGWWLGIPGVVLESLAILFNLYTFPENPELHGLVDIGPVAALWLVVVFVQMLRSRRAPEH